MSQPPSPQDRLRELAADSARQMSAEVARLLAPNGGLAREFRAHAGAGSREDLPRPKLQRLHELVDGLAGLGVPEAAQGLGVAARIKDKTMFGGAHLIPKTVRGRVSELRMSAREAFAEVGQPGEVAATVSEWLLTEPDAGEARKYAQWLAPVIDAPESAAAKDRLRTELATADQHMKRRANAALGLGGATDEETVAQLTDALEGPKVPAIIRAAALRALGERVGVEGIVDRMDSRFELVRHAALDVTGDLVLGGAEMPEETKARAKEALWRLHVGENNDAAPRALAALVRLDPSDPQIAMLAHGIATSELSSPKDRAAALGLLHAPDMIPEIVDPMVAAIVSGEPNEQVVDAVRGLPEDRRAQIAVAAVAKLDEHADRLAAGRSRQALPYLTPESGEPFVDLTDAAHTLELMAELGVQAPAEKLQPVLAAIDAQLVPTEPSKPMARAIRAAVALAPDVVATDDDLAGGVRRAVTSLRDHLATEERAPELERLSRDVVLAERDVLAPVVAAEKAVTDPQGALGDLRRLLTAPGSERMAAAYLRSLRGAGIDVTEVVSAAHPERLAAVLPDVVDAVGADGLAALAEERPDLVPVVASASIRTSLAERDAGPEVEGDNGIDGPGDDPGDLGGLGGGGLAPSGPQPASGPTAGGAQEPAGPDVPPAPLVYEDHFGDESWGRSRSPDIGDPGPSGAEPTDLADDPWTIGDSGSSDELVL